MAVTLDFTPDEANLEMYRGKGGSFEVEFFEDEEQTIPQAVPTTGWASQVRVKPNLDAELLFEFTIDASQGGAGKIVVSWTGAQVAAVTAKKGYWDLDCADTDDVYVNGTVTFEGEVTA